MIKYHGIITVNAANYPLHGTTLILPWYLTNVFQGTLQKTAMVKHHGITIVHGENYDLHDSIYNKIKIKSN